MADLTFKSHAVDEMRRDSVSVADVYHVVGDYDEMIERRDGRTEYVRIMDDGRRILVVIEVDGVEVVTVWWDRRGSRRSRRR